MMTRRWFGYLLVAAMTQPAPGQTKPLVGPHFKMQLYDWESYPRRAALTIKTWAEHVNRTPVYYETHISDHAGTQRVHFLINDGGSACDQQATPSRMVAHIANQPVAVEVACL